MANKNFLLLNLEDKKAKKIANIVGNPSCKKILDHLSKKDHATESELSKQLNIPISTIHYNLKLLSEAKLIDAEEYHYSKKGKEVQHYKLANKYIIITPGKTHGLKEKLRSILPAAIITIGIAGIIQLTQSFTTRTFSAVSEKAAAPLAYDSAPEAVRATAEPVTQTIIQTTPIWQNIALWFIIGALSALIIYLIINWIRKKD